MRHTQGFVLWDILLRPALRWCIIPGGGVLQEVIIEEGERQQASLFPFLICLDSKWLRYEVLQLLVLLDSQPTSWTQSSPEVVYWWELDCSNWHDLYLK